MSARQPSLGHRLFFWFFLATLSQVLPEVVTLNDPIPWLSPQGWILGYPAYGLHVLALAGLMYRWPIAGYSTLLAYGGLFGLYEGYWTKQLWNPNWGVEITASIGGVRLFHTLTLVFFLHPLLAFVLPLLLTERLLVKPGRLTERLPSRLRSRGGTAITLAVIAVYAAVLIGSNLPDRSAVYVPVVSIAVLSLLGLVWRLALNGHRFRMEELLPRGRWLAAFVGLLLLSYPVYTSSLRPEALPTELAPHALVWGIYLFLVVTIVAVTRRTSPVTVADRPPLTHRQAVALAGWAIGVFLLVAWLHAPHTQPGETIAVLTYLVGGGVHVLVLVFVLVRSVVKARPVTADPLDTSG